MARQSLVREFLVDLPRGSRYTIAELPLPLGVTLAQGDVIARIEAIREKKVKDGRTIVKTTTDTHIFDVAVYREPRLLSYHVSLGQELQAGSNKIASFEVEESFSNLIEIYVVALANTRSDLHRKPGIPEAKLTNAIAGYASGVDRERVLYLYDSTIFGSAKEGYLITDSGFYYCIGARKFAFRFVELESHCLETRQIKKRDKIEDNEVLTIALSRDTEDELLIDDDHRGVVLRAFRDLLTEIKALQAEGWTKEVDHLTIVQDMSNEFKLCYLSTLVWLTYIDDRQIDDRELAEIQMLLVQIKCDAKVRRTIREHVRNPTGLDAEMLIRKMLFHAPTGSQLGLSCSLIKDAIRLHRATTSHKSDTRASDQRGIQELSRLLDIETDQVAVIEEGCVSDEKILSGDITDDEKVTAAKALSAKAAAVGVPIAAIYLTGSVTGLSATGITSGLAALGLGGVLGLSSMVSGIGVAIILGVGIYMGMRWLLGNSERDKAARRELMLQEVLGNHQKSIANLAEDILDFSKELMTLTKDIRENDCKIKKLSRMLTLYGGALAKNRQKETKFESDLMTLRRTGADVEGTSETETNKQVD
ncbi:MAG: hypothetical protein OXF79_00635 [Chloroflexi bacterium]|nr:hypothetical protein [Chloroflexota bacterium]